MGILFNKETSLESSQIRKYTAMFGSLFTDFHITRVKNKRADIIHVPIKYGKGEIRNKTDGDLGDVRTGGIVLPAMAFEISNVEADHDRMPNQYIRMHSNTMVPGSEFENKYTMTPVPHNITYQLSFRTKNIEDNLAILEQIVTTFHPHVVLNVMDNDTMGIKRDITVMMKADSYNTDDNYEHTQESNRIIETTIEFVVKGYLYKKIKVVPTILEITLNSDISSFAFNAAASKDDIQAYVNTATTENIGDAISNATS